MRRLHVHLSVPDFEKSVAFYSQLFAAEPTRREAAYAKWQLDDPRVNFAISEGGGELSHLGIEAADAVDFEALKARGQEADGDKRSEENTLCCYARSDKLWVAAPEGTQWELFNTHEAVTAAEQESASQAARASSPCCGG